MILSEPLAISSALASEEINATISANEAKKPLEDVASATVQSLYHKQLLLSRFKIHFAAIYKGINKTKCRAWSATLPFQCAATCKILERRLGTPRAHNGSRKLAPNRPFQHNTRYCSRSFIRITFARRVECSLHHPGTLPRTTSFYLLNRRLLALSEQSALCTFFSLLPPGLAALLRSAGFFSEAVFFARMTLARSAFQGFQIGLKRFFY